MPATNAFDHLVRQVGNFEPGTVALVGAGPGDAGLISVRGAVRLMQADVVLHDHLIGRELLDLSAARAERIFVGKWRGQHVWTQEEINAALVRQAKAGRRVVRLKGGDPFVFGRGGEECLALAAEGIRFEVVPGITAAFGAPASAGIPLTHRGLSRSFALVTGHAEPGDPEPLDFAGLARMETIVFYMGAKNLEANAAALIEAGLDPRTPAAVIHWGTRTQQRVVVGVVSDLAERVRVAGGVKPPAMVIVGQVVKLREQMNWFESRPLFGQTIAVTRMRDQAAALSGPLRAAGAEVLDTPTIALAAVEDYTAVDAALRRLDGYNWLVVTSTNGVDALFDRLAVLGRDARTLAPVRIAAVGSATAARLQERGVRADLVPDEAVGEALAEAIIHEGVRGRRVLLLRGDLAREQLVRMLVEAGGVCDDLAVYRTVCPASLPAEFIERLDSGGLDWITLTSPSSFVNLLTLLGEQCRAALRQVKLASIGPVTTRAIRQAGFMETVEASPHDVDGLVAAIIAASTRRA